MAPSEHPGAHVRAILDEFGFAWKYEPDHLLPDPNNRVQVRSETKNAPPREVRRIRDAMKRGEEIPPPVITRDRYYVDGNTRGQAWEKNGVKRAHVIILNVDYEKASADVARRLRGLGAALNLRHGLRPDRDSVREAILRLSEDDQLDAGRISELLGEPATAVRNVILENRGAEFLRGREIENGNVGAAMLRLFGSRLDKWNDEPQVAAAKLAIDAGFDTKEFREVVQKVENDAGSDVEAMKMLTAEREANDARIRQVKFVGRGKPTPWGKMKRAVAQVQSLADDPERVIDPNPATAKPYLADLESTQELLVKVIEIQTAKLAQMELSA